VNLEDDSDDSIVLGVSGQKLRMSKHSLHLASSRLTTLSAKPPRSTNGFVHIRDNVWKSKRTINAVKSGIPFESLCENAEDVIHQLVYDPQEKKPKKANESMD
jgi:hypothetical protein